MASPILRSLAVSVLAFCAATVFASRCEDASLQNQHKDPATIERLERAWTAAYIRGDTAFGQCLLTQDFRQILRDGSVTGLREELQFAAANKDKNLPEPAFPQEEVLIHGNVAVAYGVVRLRGTSGLEKSMRFADYYLWEGKSWHSFFAQQTLVSNARG